MRRDDLPADIAIVGMAATFAGAADLREYWQNILGKTDAVAEAPDSWAHPYFDPTATGNDRIYTRRGGFLGDLAEFNPQDFGIMPNSVDGGEPDQYFALKLARDALADAGYLDRPFDRARTGVILGRGTYVNRGYTNLMQHGLVIDQTLALLRQLAPQLDGELLDELRRGLKASLPPFTAETCPGMVPNIVAGRVANRLDLMGPNFIVDAACASSLIAAGLAIEELRGGRCDMMLTGGIHASTPPQIYMIFCQLGGLSRSHIRPFDAEANGTLLGEGMGVLVLKRLADAERDRDRIYAVIKGVGTASDGKALGLLAPRLEGEIAALRRAYAASSVDPASVGLVEAHGTAIPLGDQTEVRALASVFGQRAGPVPHVGIGSVKSMIGHCIPAAGAAGMIKSALALYHKVLPPTLAGEISPELGLESTPFYVNTEARPWIHGDADAPRRAGVNAFGFGGINAHAVLEEYCGPAQHGIELVHSAWPSELVVCAADSAGELAGVLDALAEAARQDPAAPLWPLVSPGAAANALSHRAAIVCRNRDDLAQKAALLRDKLAAGSVKLQSRAGLYYAHAKERPQLAFLFPGEGAQYAGMLADLCLYFPGVRAWFDFLDQACAGTREYTPSSVVFPPPTGLTAAGQALLEQRLYAMDLGAELAFIGGMALFELLMQLGIKPDVMLGHSTGENTALVASGTLRIRDRAQLTAVMQSWNALYRVLERDGEIARGMLLTVGGVPRATLEQLLALGGERVHLAMDNCPNQAVAFGPADRMRELQAGLTAAGGVCTVLPFDRAYHTPLFAPVGRSFRSLYDTLEFACGDTPLASCTTAALFPSDPAAIRQLAEAQWSNRVRFRETIEQLYGSGIRAFVEVGPSANLTSFVEDTLRGRNALAVASNSRRRPGLEQLQHCLARLYVQGASLDLSALYRHRRTAPPVRRRASGAAGTQVLELELPRLHLATTAAEKIRDRIAASTPAPASTRAPASPPVTPGAAEPRTALLMEHFGLMREFLASQRRLIDLVGAAGAAAQAVGTGFSAHVDWPLLGQVREEQQDRLVAERRVGLDFDLYLRDHTLGTCPSMRAPELTALPVIPFTFSMEMLAEGALRLAGTGKVVRAMTAVRGYRWLTLDSDALDLRTEAQRIERGTAGVERYAVRIFQCGAHGTGPDLLVFEGQVDVAATYAAPPSLPAAQLERLLPAKQHDADLYSTGMFHGPRLRGVRHLRGWSSAAIAADLVTIATDDFFAGGKRTGFATDAGLLDAAGQLVGYWLSEQFGSDFNCFPFEVLSYEQYAAPSAPGQPVLCQAQIRFTDARQIEADFDLLDASGHTLARLRGWRDRYFSIPEEFYRCRLQPHRVFVSQPLPVRGPGVLARRMTAFPDEFLEQSWGIWGRVLAHLTLSAAERREYAGLPATGKHRTEWLLARIAAKDVVREWAKREHGVELAPADVALRNAAAGKLIVLPISGITAVVPEIAVAHSGEVAVAALGASGLTPGIGPQHAGEVLSGGLLAAALGAGEQSSLVS